MERSQGQRSTGDVEERGELAYFSKQWRDNEENAIFIGLDLDTYWNLNPIQYDKYRNAFLKKREEDRKEKDYLNHLLGQYIWIAFNNPKEYPEKSFLSENIQKEHKEQSSIDMERMARINTLLMGGVINNEN